MPNKLVSGAIICLTLLTLLSACGQSKVQSPGGQADKPGQERVNASGPEQTAKPPVQDNNKEAKVKAYFGDENGERLVELETTVTYKQDDEKYSAALTALTKAPDSKRIALMKGITVKSTVFKNQMLTVDLTIAPEGRLGSGGEDLLLQAIKKTVFQFSEIQSLEILVDGKAVDSLMGHMELPHPIKR